jgi:hypothetical protein
MWRTLWQKHANEIMGDWVENYPGSRPPVWLRFINAHLPSRLDDESEIQYLEGAHQIHAREAEFLRRRALQLLKHNLVRSPLDPLSHFLPDENGYIAYALRNALVSEQDIPTLHAEKCKYAES